MKRLTIVSLSAFILFVVLAKQLPHNISKAHAQDSCPNLPLVTVDGVQNSVASMAKLIPNAHDSFLNIRQAVLAATGVDALGRTSDMLRPASLPAGTGSINRSWHKTGRAVDLYTTSLYNLPTSGAFTVTPEGQLFRVVANGPLGSIDVTALFEAQGWNRIPKHTTDGVLEWWHYEYHPGGVDWYTAMRQVWPLSTLQSAFPTIDWTRVACTGFNDDPPLLSVTPTPNNNWGYVGPTPRKYYVLPVGEENTCYPPEWFVTNANVRFDANTCPRGEELIPDGDIECKTCAKVVPPAMVSPLYPRRPTNQDKGQKDGTAYSGDARSFRYYDYDTGQYVEVPPMPFGKMGQYNAIVIPEPTINPDISDTPTPTPTLLPPVPCGWPNDSSTSRTVTSGCSSPNNNPGHCPADATYCANGVSSGQKVDIEGVFPIFATLRGTAYRCINETSTTTYASRGVYVIVIGIDGVYRTISSHLATQLPGDAVATTHPSDSPCFGSDIEVTRFAVNSGDYIGVVGLTGNTTHNHLEYEIIRSGSTLCPATYMDYTNAACSSIAAIQPSSTEASSNMFMSFIRWISPLQE
ncbi:hypothetical protein HGA91_01260 [candidate division WWE3 bacterium]|nr:hypothetical protein [candidate division WWE3 bacterium]